MKNAIICSIETTEMSRLKNMLLSHGFDEILESSDNNKGFKLAMEHLVDLLIVDIDSSDERRQPSPEYANVHLGVPMILLGSGYDGNKLRNLLSTNISGFLTKPVREAELISVIELAKLHKEEIESLKDKVEALESTIESRKVIEKAKGLLMSEKNMTEPDAFRKMQKLAMDKRKTLKQIADAILLTYSSGLKE